MLNDDDSDRPDRAPELAPAARTYRRRPRRSRPRAQVLTTKRMTRIAAIEFAKLFPPVEDVDRPQTRRDCLPGGCNEARPCPFVSCKYHLAIDVTDVGSLKFNFPDLEPWELRETCALDVADRGGVTLEEAGELVNLTRERIRQVEVRGLIQLKRDPATRRLDIARYGEEDL